MKNSHFGYLFFCLFLLFGAGCNEGTSEVTPTLDKKTLLSNFQNPPNEARPRVWWHWMNGNVTKSGIEKDLAWMYKIGIGGFHNFDANLFTPLMVEDELIFMKEGWQGAFRFAVEKAKQHDFEIAIAGSPGWSLTGGPWVPKEDGMKKYVWTETKIEGGKLFNGTLPQPSDVVGDFQNIIPEEGGTASYADQSNRYYQDALVVAFRLPEEEQLLADLKPTVSSSGGSFSLEELTDTDLNSSKKLPPKEVGEDIWIQYEFPQPQTFRALTLVGANVSPLGQFEGNPENRTLYVSNDGTDFREVASLSGSVAAQHTVRFAPTEGKYWRMAWKTLPPPFNPFLLMAGLPPETESTGVEVAEFVLHNTDRIDQFEDKAGFSPWKEDTPSYASEDLTALAPETIIDLTESMQQDGTLEWNAPDGEWVVLRFGYSLTGRQNHPASPGATGLEVDKLDEEAVQKYINAYLDMYDGATGGQLGKGGLSHMIIDSYESGHSNWTHDFPAEFEKRRGYSILPWMPVLTGRFVQGEQQSEKFLWDFRKTIGEMIAENHYDVIGEELHKRGMQRYTESHENKRMYLADGMDVKRKADIPMAAMWTPGSLGEDAEEEVRSKADIREAASVANIYGQNLVAAESMTAVGRPFQDYPEKLKRTADMELASGLNRFVLHTSVHQPLDDKIPGFSLGPFGQYFTRHETWANQAKPWIDYLSRSCYLLQQGENVADVLYFYGENTNITHAFNEALPQVQGGFEYDFVNSTALLEAIEFKNGRLTATSGNTYELLYLDSTAQYMTLPVLKKLQQLTQAGANIAGVKPRGSFSLSDDEAEFQKIVAEVWSQPNVIKGSVNEALETLGIAKDVEVMDTDHTILYRHRATSDQDIFWFNNRSISPTSATVRMRISGKKPELWHPQTGEVLPVSYTIENGTTTVSLDLESWDAVFIVFMEETTENSFTVPKRSKEQVLNLKGPWAVDFKPARGEPQKATFNSLESWTDREETEIKHFSGTATYRITFDLPALADDAEYELDLGQVNHLATVTLNGESLGTLWKRPFAVDLTKTLKEGENTLEVDVTNLWVNRLIGDAQLDAKDKTTFTTMPFYRGQEPLFPSGLIGDVIINQLNQ